MSSDEQYDPRAVQDKWQARWAELDPFKAAEDDDGRERRGAGRQARARHRRCQRLLHTSVPQCDGGALSQ